MTDLTITIIASFFSAVIGAIVTLSIERYRTELKIISRLRETQFTLYSELWCSLYDLKLSADKLWKKADIPNLKDFVRQLQDTEFKINRSSLLIEENNIKKLRELISKFWDFRFGKKRLMQLRQEQRHYRDVNNDMIAETVRQNRLIKNDYETFISEIETSLRKQLRTI